MNPLPKLPARLFSSALLLSLLSFGHAATAFANDAHDFFERKIRPVLVEHCYECHSLDGQQIEGGLRLDSRDAFRRGGDSGPAIQVENAAESLVISALKYDGLEMPPNQKLSNEIVRDFEKWIEQGAVDPREEHTPPIENIATEIDYEQGREFWSFQRPVRPELPVHSLQDWTSNRIDDFVAEKLEQHQLRPAPDAQVSTLFRRLSFDLAGLPPTSEQISRWRQAVAVASASEGTAALFNPSEPASGRTPLDATIDELLSSPTFGEHWARLWLDLMRYAVDQAHIVGDDKSLFFPNAHLYRDWVIGAFNSDMPYDRFIVLQLAADLVTPEDPQDDVALGFVGLGPKYYQRNRPAVQAEEWEDRVDILSRGLLGITVACARCHDHKFDPVGTSDYYALAGVFASTRMFNRPLSDDGETNDKGEAKDPEQAMHIIREAEQTDLAVMIRGDVDRRGPVIPRGFLTVLSQDARHEFSVGSGRLELAEQIISAENPLVARVLVNRVWSKIMGRPLVGTPSNFGSLGERPTHPDLLDDLAVRFMENGWSLKWLCREIVSSATYRQASHVVDANTDVDPQNKWLSRMNRKRLSVEQLRDAMLRAAGTLQVGLPAAGIDPSDPTANQRTVYSQVSRLKLNPMLALFDHPDPNVHSDTRIQTTSATQKLFMMNSPFVIAKADAIAQLVSGPEATLGQAIEEAYERLLSRQPSSAELAAAVHYIAADASNFDQYVHALMMSNEFIFID